METKHFTPVTFPAYAKINLSLNVLSFTGRLHILDTVIAPVSLADAITVSPAPAEKKDTVTFTGLSAQILNAHPPEKNTAFKALAFFRDYAAAAGKDFPYLTCVINKQIPIAGGFGGSSADAAAILSYFYSKYFPGSEPDSAYLAGAAAIGADVPLMLRPGYCRAVGENSPEYFTAPPIHAVLAAGNGGVPTADCFKLFRETETLPAAPADNLKVCAALKTGDLPEYKNHAGNALLPAALKISPEITSTLAALTQAGATAAQMTGSGNGCFGMFSSESAAKTAALKLAEILPFAAYVTVG